MKSFKNTSTVQNKSEKLVRKREYKSKDYSIFKDSTTNTEGYKDKKGNIIVQGFKMCYKFQEGLGLVKRGVSSMGILNIYSWVKEDGTYLENCNTGEILMFDQASSFENGVAIAIKDGRHSLINREGKILFENAKYIEDFYGQPYAQINTGYSEDWINKDGKLLNADILEKSYTLTETYPFAEGKAMCCFSNGKYANITESGEVYKNMFFDDLTVIDNGVGYFKQDNEIGWINKNYEKYPYNFCKTNKEEGEEIFIPNVTVIKKAIENKKYYNISELFKFNSELKQNLIKRGLSNEEINIYEKTYLLNRHLFNPEIYPEKISSKEFVEKIKEYNLH